MALSTATSIISTAPANYSTSKKLQFLFFSYSTASAAAAALSSLSSPYLNLEIADSRMSTLPIPDNVKLYTVSLPEQNNVLETFSMKPSYTTTSLVPLFNLMRSVLLSPKNSGPYDIDVKTEMFDKQGNTRFTTSVSTTGVSNFIQFENNSINTRSEHHSVEPSLMFSSITPVFSLQGSSEQKHPDSRKHSRITDTNDSQPITLKGYAEKESSLKSNVNSVLLSINNRDNLSSKYKPRPTTEEYGLQSSFSSEYIVNVETIQTQATLGESTYDNIKNNNGGFESAVVYSSSLYKSITTDGFAANEYSFRQLSSNILDQFGNSSRNNIDITKTLNDVIETSDLQYIFTKYSMKDNMASSFEKYSNVTTNIPTMNHSNETRFDIHNYITGSSVYKVRSNEVLDTISKHGVSIVNEGRTTYSIIRTTIDMSQVSSANETFTDINELTNNGNLTRYTRSVSLNRMKQSINLKRKEILSTKSVLYMDGSLKNNIAEFTNQDTTNTRDVYIGSINTQNADQSNDKISVYKLSDDDIEVTTLSTILENTKTHTSLIGDVDLNFDSPRVVDNEELRISLSKTSVNLYHTLSKDSSPVVNVVTNIHSFQIDRTTPLVLNNTDDKSLSINATSTHQYLHFETLNMTHNVLNSMSIEQNINPNSSYLTSLRLSNSNTSGTGNLFLKYTNVQSRSLRTQTQKDNFSNISNDLTHQLNISTLTNKLSHGEAFSSELRSLFLHPSFAKLKDIVNTDNTIQLHRTPNKAFDEKLINHTFKSIIKLPKSNIVNTTNNSFNQTAEIKPNVTYSQKIFTKLSKESYNFSPNSNITVERYTDTINVSSLSTTMTKLSQNALPEVNSTASGKNMLTEAILESASTNISMVPMENTNEPTLLTTTFETIGTTFTSATDFDSRMNNSTEGFAFQNTITTDLLPISKSEIRNNTYKVSSQFESQNEEAETLVDALKIPSNQLYVSIFDNMVMKTAPIFNFDDTITMETMVLTYENKLLKFTMPSVYEDTLLETSHIINIKDNHTDIILKHEFRTFTTEAQPTSRFENNEVDYSSSSLFETKDDEAVPISPIAYTELGATGNLDSHKMRMNNKLSSSFLDTFMRAKETSATTTRLPELKAPFQTQIPDNFITNEPNDATFQLSSMFNQLTDIAHHLTTSIINELPSSNLNSEEYLSKNIDQNPYASHHLLYPSLIDNGIISNHMSKEELTNPSEIVNVKTYIHRLLKEPIIKHLNADLFVSLVPTTTLFMNRQDEDKMTRFESRMTTNIPNVTPMLPEADFPGEKPDKPEVIRSGVDQLILPISIVGVFLVNVIAAIIVLVCRRKRRSSTKPR
ncbi:uncharacterized protein LOC134718801 isoform X2 [Mytilus trossulus]|uniref:uncharacterized protein LOC134718801 isoform X2 n=1 Tax=Mytilus trossulus TaxID=6551 RepID=UPI00300555CF